MKKEGGAGRGITRTGGGGVRSIEKRPFNFLRAMNARCVLQKETVKEPILPNRRGYSRDAIFVKGSTRE